MSEHTKGPWRTQRYKDECSLIVSVADASLIIAEVAAEAVARRIVAAVNACEGISTEVLEGGARHDWGDLMQALEAQLAEANDRSFRASEAHVVTMGNLLAMTAHRDQLLAALSDMVDMMDRNDEPGAGSEWHTKAAAAIAAAKDVTL